MLSNTFLQKEVRYIANLIEDVPTIPAEHASFSALDHNYCDGHKGKKEDQSKGNNIRCSVLNV